MTRFATGLAGLALVLAVGTGSAAAQVQDWRSEKPPVPGPSKPAPFPAYDVRTLPNGLRVVVVPHTEQPVVSLQMLVRAGAAMDAVDKAGLANMTALLLTQGTRARSAREIAAVVDGAGGELTVSTGADAAFAQITILKDGFDLAVDLLADVIRQPVFAGEELERQRRLVRSALKVSYADPSYLASIVFNRLVFGTHAYGLPTDGTPDTLAAITRDDVVGFHARYYVPNNAILAVVGDVDSETAIAGVRRAFGTWTSRPLPVPAAPGFPTPERRAVVIDKPDAVLAEIRVGQRGPARRDDAFLATDLAVRILGGEGGNRLQRILRTRRGLTYTASARLDTYLRSGVIRADTVTMPPAAGEGVRVVVEEFSTLRRERVDAEELEAAQAFVRGSYPMGLEVPGAISTKVLLAMLHEVPFSQLETYTALSDAITADTMQTVLQSQLAPDRLTAVVVGPGAAIAPALRAVGFKDVEVIPLAELDVADPTLKRAVSAQLAAAVAVAAPAARMASKEEWDIARDVVGRAAAAAGGLDLLQQVTTVSASARTTLYLPTGPIRAETKTLIAYPDRLRVDAVTPLGLVVQAFDAGHAWIWEQRGQRDAPDVMRREFDTALRRDWIRLVVDAAADRLTGRRVGDETAAGGRPLHVVELWSDQLLPVRLAIDAASGRLERITYRTPGPFGPETLSESYSDFRTVGGVLFPFRAVVRRDDAPVLERAILELKINPVLQPGVFQKPK